MRFFFSKTFHLLATLVGVTVIAFLLIRIVPGDPVMLLLGERGASPEVYQEMKKNLGLDKPLPVQYIDYLFHAVQGDLGTSIVSKRSVMSEFSARFPATLELSIVGLLFAVILGIPLGIIAAVKRNTFWDYSVTGISLIGYSMPIFWWGLILILIFSVQLGITPVSGRIDFLFEIKPVTGLLLIDTWFSPEGFAAFKSAFAHLILPSIAMGTIPLAVIARMTRATLLEVLKEDYIRTAKAKGVSYYQTVVKHALRNALIPIVTVIGLMMGSLITGAILTETIFSWPGIGKWIVASVQARDYPVIQSGILLIATLVVLVNIFVDLIYVFINPTIRES
jgi:dipeptide transport system permease protein